MGFTEDDGPNPHGKTAFVQPPQRDGRTPPPLPPRPKALWHQSQVKQGATRGTATTRTDKQIGRAAL